MTTRTLIALLAATTLLVGCNKEDTPAETTPDTLTDTTEGTTTDTVKEAVEEATDDAKAETEAAVEDTKEAAAGKAEELRARAVAMAEDRLTALQSQLKALEGKLDSASMPAKAIATPLLSTANERLAEVPPMIDALKNANIDSWSAASQELTSAIDSLENAVKAVASKLGK